MPNSAVLWLQNAKVFLEFNLGSLSSVGGGENKAGRQSGTYETQKQLLSRTAAPEELPFSSEKRGGEEESQKLIDFSADVISTRKSHLPSTEV